MSVDQKKSRSWLKVFTGVAAAFGLVLSTVAFAGAQAAPVVVYDGIGPGLPTNVISQPFEAEQVNEFGDLVALGPGPRNLTKVSVVLSTQACQSGSGTPQCTTENPDATFGHPMTLNLYNVAGTTGAPTVGSEIASVTHTITLPYRPSASAECDEFFPGRWLPEGGELPSSPTEPGDCATGRAIVVDFAFPAGTVLPETLIWAIAYNTETAGYDPVGVDGPIDFVNVGAESFNPEPAIGTDVDPDVAFISAEDTADELVAELGWDGLRPLALIETEALTTDVPATTAPPTSPSTPDPTGTPGPAPAGAPLSFAG